MAVQLLDDRVQQHLHPLSLVLMHEDEFGLLPEVFQAFGEEHLIRFLDIFAGRTLTIPDRDVLHRRIRDVRIWVTMNQDSGAAPELAKEYGLSEPRIHDINQQIARLASRFGITAVVSDGGEEAAAAQGHL